MEKYVKDRRRCGRGVKGRRGGKGGRMKEKGMEETVRGRYGGRTRKNYKEKGREKRKTVIQRRNGKKKE